MIGEIDLGHPLGAGCGGRLRSWLWRSSSTRWIRLPRAARSSSSSSWSSAGSSRRTYFWKNWKGQNASDSSWLGLKAWRSARSRRRSGGSPAGPRASAVEGAIIPVQRPGPRDPQAPPPRPAGPCGVGESGPACGVRPARPLPAPARATARGAGIGRQAGEAGGQQRRVEPGDRRRRRRAGRRARRGGGHRRGTPPRGASGPSRRPSDTRA